MIYYYDRLTDTVRRYGNLDDPFEGERFDKKSLHWSRHCCPKSGCQWDEEITEEQAKKIIEGQWREK